MGILGIIFVLISVCLGLGFGYLLVYEVDDVDKIIIECINGTDDTELDCFGW